MDRHLSAFVHRERFGQRYMLVLIVQLGHQANRLTPVFLMVQKGTLNAPTPYVAKNVIGYYRI